MKTNHRILKVILIISAIIAFFAAKNHDGEKSLYHPITENNIKIIVLGISQDAGAPHIGCLKNCCQNLRKENRSHPVASIAIVDEEEKKYWVIDASPDFPAQVQMVADMYGLTKDNYLPEGLFLSHAHIGHYTGMMYLGREGMNSINVKVYAMSRMTKFISENGPWSQLLSLNNIKLQPLTDQKEIYLSKRLRILPFTVPHRDEFSETVGFEIKIDEKTVLYIPDIDNWGKMDASTKLKIEQSDLIFFDATFYNSNELPERFRSEIPHPEVVKTMEIVKKWGEFDKSRFVFTHINHSNPILNENSEQYKKVIESGFQVAKTGSTYSF